MTSKGLGLQTRMNLGTNMGAIARADAAALLQHVPPGGADLAYLDPPFAVDRKFSARPESGAVRERAKGPVAYEDTWPSLEVYLAWLGPRLEVAYRALAPHGTLWLHLDHRASHEAHHLASRLFGRDRFVGEIVWVPGNGAKARSGLAVTHQTLLVFARGRDYLWNSDDPALREPYAKTSLSMHFQKTDEQGRSYRDRTANGKTYRYYADRGRAIGSVWTDCPAMVANTPLMRESTGYPTQKPLKLLDRIVRAASREGGLVVDPFCGSGTALVASARAGRRFFGGDLGESAVRTTRARLEEEGVIYTYVEDREVEGASAGGLTTARPPAPSPASSPGALEKARG